MVVLMRRTNRLAMHLASNGHAVYHDEEGWNDDRENEWVWTLRNPVEVEFFTSATVVNPTKANMWAFPFLTRRHRRYERMFWMTEADSERIAETSGSFPFPPQTNHLDRQLSAFLTYPYDEQDRGYEILPFREANDHNDFMQAMKVIFRHDEADILWLSPTEFVSVHCFDGTSGYSYAMSVNGWKLMAYSFPQLDSTDGRLRFGPVSDLPLRFVYYMLAPNLRKVSSFTIEISAATPVDAALALIPRKDHNPTKNTTVFLPYPSTELLHALSTFPIYHRVRLRLGHAYRDDPLSPQELNDILRGFRFPVHLQVPRSLLSFNCENEPFTANPSFTSLTISTYSTPLSSKMLEGIARNKSMDHLVIDCRDWEDHRNDIATPSLMKAVFCNALQGGTNLKCLTIVSRCEKPSVYQTDKPEPAKIVQQAFERLGEELEFTSRKRHCVAQLHWTFPRIRYRKPRIKCNMLWDSEFSPTLVLNCLRRQPGGCPPAILLDLATRRINQGILFKYATNLVPWDLSASHASAIFEILYRSVDHDWLQKADGL
jgi:hypothetical protein